MILYFKGSVGPLLRSNHLFDWVEVPLLAFLIVSPSSLPNITVTMTLSHSVVWKSGSQVECSVGIESEFFNQSLVLFLELINIDNSPSLMSTIFSICHDNSVSFSILSSLDFKYLVSLYVDNVSFLVSELEWWLGS